MLRVLLLAYFCTAVAFGGIVDGWSDLLDEAVDTPESGLEAVDSAVNSFQGIIDGVLDIQDLIQLKFVEILKATGVVSKATGLLVLELIEYFGYNGEAHDVVTEDGYILTLHRIPCAKGETGGTEGKPVVLFLPSALSDSSVFISKGPKESLGFFLVEAGYDAWFLNPRGNTYSKKHKNLDPTLDKEKFFDYSFTEKALFDLPSTIDYILETTGQKSLKIVAHGEGATLVAVLASELPEYVSKISYSAFIQPIIYLEDMESVFALLAPKRDVLKAAFDVAGWNGFLYHLDLYTNIGALLCNKYSPVKSTCLLIANLFYGTDNDGFDFDHFPLLASALPAGISTKETAHLAYLTESGRFGKYDYSEKNQEVYGQDTPPDFKIENLKNITIGLYYGDKDIFVVPKNFEKLSTVIPNLKRSYCQANFGHLDTLFHKNVSSFNRIIADDLCDV